MTTPPSDAVASAPSAFPPVADVVTPHYEDDMVTLHHGDCLDVLRTLPDASVDAVVTDPPYGLGFMGKEWDTPGRAARATTTAIGKVGKGQFGSAEYGGASYGGNHVEAMRYFGEWCEQWARECLRVLKPGGHILTFGGTRTWHRLACAIEDAGFEVRDSIAWLYGSGFPKSLDVSKAIDKSAGAEREVIGDKLDRPGYHLHGHNGGEAFGHGIASTTPETRLAAALITAPATDAAKTWQGWGTALKPAYEPVVVGRKPLAGTVAGNVLTHGTGALNIDACRTATTDSLGGGAATKGSASHTEGWDRPWKNDPEAVAAHAARVAENVIKAEALGRWPTNVVLDDSQAVELDAQTGVLTSGANPTRRGSDKFRDAYGDFAGQETCEPARGADSGGASRFFPTFRYEAKAPTDERPRDGDVAHPTVKPLDLMRWLVRLVTPPGGVVLEPFAGSGTTAEACVIEGFHCIAVEREAAYLPLIVARLSKPIQPDLFGGAA